VVDRFLSFGLNATTKEGADGREQFRYAERLLDIVVGAMIERGDEVGLWLPARKCDYGNVRATAYLENWIVATQIGEVERSRTARWGRNSVYAGIAAATSSAKNTA
jgi:hypothetical protein